LSDLKEKVLKSDKLKESIRKDTNHEIKFKELLKLIPDAKIYWICENHNPPIRCEGEYCEICKRDTCSYQYNFDIPVQLAFILSLLTDKEFEITIQNIEKLKKSNLNDFKKPEHNLYEYYSGLFCAILGDKKFAKFSDLIFPLLYSINGVAVAKSGKFRTVYVGWASILSS